MPQRQYNTEREAVVHANKRITLPIELEAYQRVVADAASFRQWLDGQIATYPELFPRTIGEGYQLHDRRQSAKMPELWQRRIKLHTPDAQGRAQVFTIAPSAVLPYLSGATDAVAGPLLMASFGVPCWALAEVFGRDESYWYRLTTHFGRYNIVQSTLKEAAHLPAHLLADEKHLSFQGQTAYLAMTVGEECVLGASLALGSDAASLTTAYAVFQQEAQAVHADYTPQTVNLDGWLPTHYAWQALFPAVQLILCFLHAFLKIRERARRLPGDLWPTIQEQVWEVYHAPCAHTFRTRLAAFQAWSQQENALSQSVQAAIAKLAAKVEQYVLSFDHPDAYRTSNMIDRHMSDLTRWLCHLQGFHGDWASAERLLRSWVLFHNFRPFSPRAAMRQTHASRAHKLTGTRYHQNWLHNLLCATSLAGVPP